MVAHLEASSCQIWIDCNKNLSQESTGKKYQVKVLNLKNWPKILILEFQEKHDMCLKFEDGPPHQGYPAKRALPAMLTNGI